MEAHEQMFGRPCAALAAGIAATKSTPATTTRRPHCRVSVQMALLLRNICQFDFPGSWQTPIDSLLTAAGCQDPATGAQLPPERGLRALKALKQVLRGLQTKRFVADATAPGTRKRWHGASTCRRVIACCLQWHKCWPILCACTWQAALGTRPTSA